MRGPSRSVLARSRLRLWSQTAVQWSRKRSHEASAQHAENPSVTAASALERSGTASSAASSASQPSTTSTSRSAPRSVPSRATSFVADALEEHEAVPGPLPSQRLRDAIMREWILSPEFRIHVDSVQPASVDLRLGDKAWPLRCSFLPDTHSSVERKVEGLAFPETLDLRDGAILEKDRPYLIPLIEELRLPDGMRAKTNPKSSTGRLDIFTRVITDHNARFDEISEGYRGKLYLEVVPRSFAIRVKTGLALNQIRLFESDAMVTDDELRDVHKDVPLLYVEDTAVPTGQLDLAGGLFLSADLQGPRDRLVGYRAKKNSMPLDLTRGEKYTWRDFWDPVFPDEGARIILDPEVFYLLMSAESVVIPPFLAAEMMAYDPTAGELRTHYAGFFDPGFGARPAGERPGSRAALEVRARDVPFMIEHRQPICKLVFERMSAVPDVIYGADLDSNYQGQTTMLSKHFAEQTASIGQLRLRAHQPPLEPTARMFSQ